MTDRQTHDGFSGKGLIGMVHVGALPGTPSHADSIDAIVDRAVREAKMIADAGFDAIIVENMHDTPYVHGDELGPEIVAGMTRVAAEVVPAVSIPVGVQILSGGNRHALAVAHTTGASFIRCENFVFSHVADEGLLAKAEAGQLLRYRRSIGADGVRIFCDIKKKHASHALTADIDIAGAVQAAEFFGADGLIVTGQHTGTPADIEDLRQVRAATDLPLLVGSGVTPETVPALLDLADGLIVGSAIKHDGTWSNGVDAARCRAVVAARR